MFPNFLENSKIIGEFSIRFLSHFAYLFAVVTFTNPIFDKNREHDTELNLKPIIHLNFCFRSSPFHNFNLTFIWKIRTIFYGITQAPSSRNGKLFILIHSIGVLTANDLNRIESNK